MLFRSRMFGDSPLREAIHRRNGADELFLLSQEEFLEPSFGFSPNIWNVQKTRWAKGTPWAIHQRGLYVDPDILTSPYWTSRIQSAEGYKLQIVGYNGHLSWGAYTRINIGLRPSVLLDATRIRPVAGAGTREDPFLLELIPKQVSDTPFP